MGAVDSVSRFIMKMVSGQKKYSHAVIRELFEKI